MNLTKEIKNINGPAITYDARTDSYVIDAGTAGSHLLQGDDAVAFEREAVSIAQMAKVSFDEAARYLATFFPFNL